MAIDTFQTLKESIINWSKRGDILSLTEDFIAIAESLMYSNPDASLRIRDMEARATDDTNTTDRFMPLPTGYVQMRQVKINLDDLGEPAITFVPPESMIIKEVEGIPVYYTIGSQIEFDRISDDEYEIEMLYYRTLTPLSATNTTNAILTRFPQIYLYGALFACKDWTMQSDEAIGYYQKFIAAIKGANQQDRRGRYHAPSIRVAAVTP